MEQKNEISKHALLSLERQAARLIEILKVAVIVLLTVLLSIPLVGALLGIGGAGQHGGSAWSGVWLYGLLAIYAVNYWWSSSE